MKDEEVKANGGEKKEVPGPGAGRLGESVDVEELPGHGRECRGQQRRWHEAGGIRDTGPRENFWQLSVVLEW